MNTQVLVAYATKYGATAGIAEKIGQILGQAGLHVEVLPVDRVNDLSSYQAVVLGSAAYIGRWRKEAAKFLKSNEKVLADKLVWLFSSGPTEQGNPVDLMEGWRFPKSLRKTTGVLSSQRYPWHGKKEPPHFAYSLIHALRRR